MAVNLVFTTYYGLMLNGAEELVEKSPFQEILEKHVDEKSDFLITSFRFLSPLIEKEESFYNRKNSDCFSTYEQKILLPPPDFFRYSF